MRLLLLLSMLLASCATVAITRVNGPDGPMYEATCYSSQRDCYNGAANKCRGEYHVLDKSSSDRIATVGNINGTPQYATSSKHQMYFRCGAADEDEDETEAH